MDKKIKEDNSYNGLFLGLNSESELFDKLFEKSIFIFPELDIQDRWVVSAQMAYLTYKYITLYGSNEVMILDYKDNDESQKLVCNLARFSAKCFANYMIQGNVICIKLNLRLIKKLWLKADHEITERELRIQFINTITGSIKEILNITNGLPENAISKYNANEVLNESALNLMMLATALKGEVKLRGVSFQDEKKNN